ncbi:MAG: hypothetical protein KKH94_03965 [Candidatus Omnitrophica bacterium]|nr:hypothetical protein [Candidatus Omnitrophota bacterium]
MLSNSDSVPCANMRRSRNFRITPLTFIGLTLLVTTLIFSTGAFATPSFNILDAGERGVEKSGSSEGNVITSVDGITGNNVLECDYSIPKGSSIKVRLKNFPSTLTKTAINSAQIGLRSAKAEEITQIQVTADIQGTKSTQRIPLRIGEKWVYRKRPIEWKSIGDLSEIVFTITSTGDADPATGTVYFNLNLFKYIPPKKKVPEIKSAVTPALTPAKEEKPKSVPLKTAFTIMDANKRGILKSGDANGSALPTFADTIDKDILECDYTLPKGTNIEILAKKFPKELNSDTINTVRIYINVPTIEQTADIAAHIEIRGKKDTQTILLELFRGWNTLQESLNWDMIDELNEVSLIINHKGEKELVKGTIAFALNFVKQGLPKETITPPKDFTALYSHLDAGAKGMFNIGPGNGVVKCSFHEEVAKDVWKFDYTVPIGAIVGVWSQKFPAGLSPENVDAVRIGVNMPTPEQVNQVAVKVEIKGETTMQKIPLTLQPGWNYFHEQIDWGMVGTIKEFVFVVSPMAGGPTIQSPMGGSPIEVSRAEGPPQAMSAPLTGTLYMDVNFYKLSFIEKNFMFIKLISISIISLLLIGLISLCSSFRFKPKGTPSARGVLFNDTFLSRIIKDFIYAVVIVGIAGIVLSIYSQGTISSLDAGISFSFLFIGLIGVLIAEVLKFQITGKHLTPAEVFQNMLFSGLLAAAASRQELLQAPSSWQKLFMVSSLTAAVTFLIYHFFNMYSLVTSGRHLRPITSTLLVMTPFLCGWLLLVENITIIQNFFNVTTGGLLMKAPFLCETLSRIFVVFIFNELLINGIGLVIKRRTLSQFKEHILVLFVSFGVIVAPLIADVGSSSTVAALPTLISMIIAMITTMLSYAGLWGEVYLITGILLDAGHHTAPSWKTLSEHVRVGMKKGAWFSGYLLGLLFAISIFFNAGLTQTIMKSAPLLCGIIFGALVFPLLKTIIETFDGSFPFFERAKFSYGHGTLYARGAVVGYGFTSMVSQGMFELSMPERIVFGLMVGLAASVGVSLLRDATFMVRGQGKIQSWKLYLTDGLLGAFVGSAAAFYLDARQVPVVIEKFKLYTSSGFDAVRYITYPLVNKWGRIDLGSYTGGSKLLFTESLAGVINWSIAAWLFAINKVFMQAYFEKQAAPIKFFFSKAGVAMLIEHMIYVLRWGLWMSPIIFTFLRMMPQPTWYNQDGAIRTLFAIYHNATSSPEAFNAWSLKLFVWVLAFDFFRVLIWMDHMGLRVATLVNLSFLGLDRFDEWIAEKIGPAAAQRYLPEAVKRFCTWGPLLIPFYLPRGADWDYCWSTAEAMQAAGGGGIISFIQSLPFGQLLLLIGAALLIATGISFRMRSLHNRTARRRIKSYDIHNREYKVVVKENSEIYSEVDHQKRTVFPPEYDVTRRSYDMIEPCGRILYLLDTQKGNDGKNSSWPIIGNFPTENFNPSRITRIDDSLKIVNITDGIKTTIDINIPDQDSLAEIWTITVENQTHTPRALKIVPYCEWVLNGGLHDRFHTQYARLFPEMEYVSDVNAVLAWHKGTKSMGILAAEKPTEGFLTSRMDFIGRAQSYWTPRVFQTLAFEEARDTAGYPTFDPIGSLLMDCHVKAKSSKQIRLMIGYATNKKEALDLIKEHLKPTGAHIDPSPKKKQPLIGHGEILPGTPQPYSDYIHDGNTLSVHTPYTTRPYDHAMSNPVHSLMVTNRGLHTSCNGNSQQNRLTPDWPDTVTKEVPQEAIYLYDVGEKEWYCPTLHPLNDHSAENTCEFSVDGSATFHMKKGDIATELTVFVPPNDPTGVYLLTVKNNSNTSRKMRVAPYFQMVLEFQPEKSGTLRTRYDKDLNALFFNNPRNIFRVGWAFASMTTPAECIETRRGRFFGRGRSTAHPVMVEEGKPDRKQYTDDRQIAAFLGTLNIPANSERTVAIILGQTDKLKEAKAVVKKYRTVKAAQSSLKATRTWWLSLMKTVEVQTNQPEFDQILNWLKYQALAERIWARRGFYQTSGAYGFRDQLQDCVNLLWVEPSLARKQIVLAASHQFYRGDVYHWFFTRTDGRTAFACRSHASDNPLWLAWATAEYLQATGDESLLDEMTSYVISEFPFALLPKNKIGYGHIYHRSTRADSVYRHCMKSIDLVFNKRLGKNGLPLIQVGDWNDGLDEIGSEGIGESVWLGFFLYYIMKGMINVIEKRDGKKSRAAYQKKMDDLGAALEASWRQDRYLRAYHDDGTEIGVKDSGIWETDALTAAWAVYCNINPKRSEVVFNTALNVLERENAVLLGWPALREDSKPYLGRSSKYPEGVRENGMYCHGVQWMIRAARLLTERFDKEGNEKKAAEYREIAYRLWRKTTPVGHVTPKEIEIFGGQPNKQCADILTNYDIGRMIWNGYTGAAGWLFRQSMEGVIGASLHNNKYSLPDDLDQPRGKLKIIEASRDLKKSPFKTKKVSILPPEAD